MGLPRIPDRAADAGPPLRGSAFAILILPLACRAGPRPGQAGDAYNVRDTYAGRLLVEGEALGGEVDLAAAVAGSVRGSFRMRRPLAIEGPATITHGREALSARLSFRR
jgi:hypothetical protein